MKKLLILLLATLFILGTMAVGIACNSTNEDEIEAATIELHKVEIAVFEATIELPREVLGQLNPLNAGYISPGEVAILGDAINTVTYTISNDGTFSLDIGSHITGGLDSLTYEYHIASNCDTTPLTGPLSE